MSTAQVTELLMISTMAYPTSSLAEFWGYHGIYLFDFRHNAAERKQGCVPGRVTLPPYQERETKPSEIRVRCLRNC